MAVLGLVLFWSVWSVGVFLTLLAGLVKIAVGNLKVGAFIKHLPFVAIWPTLLIVPKGRGKLKTLIRRYYS